MKARRAKAPKPDAIVMEESIAAITASISAGWPRVKADRELDLVRNVGLCLVELHRTAAILAEADTGADFDPVDAAAIVAARSLVDYAIELAASLLQPAPAAAK